MDFPTYLERFRVVRLRGLAIVIHEFMIKINKTTRDGLRELSKLLKYCRAFFVPGKSGKRERV